MAAMAAGGGGGDTSTAKGLAASAAWASRPLGEDEGRGDRWVPGAGALEEDDGDAVGGGELSFDKPSKRFVADVSKEYAVQGGSGGMLGKGSFGEVYIAQRLRDGASVAVKKIKPSKRSAEGIGLNTTSLARDKSAANHEAALMKRVAGHGNVLSIVDHIEDDRYVYIVMEYCQGGDLMKYIQQSANFSEQVAAYLFRQMLLGVAHCHERGVAHRDIKPDNFLFVSTDGEAHLKLADFGLSTEVSGPDDIITDAVGSAFFIAPEVFRRKYTLACDAWSLGVLLYLMLSGTVPFGANATKPHEVHRSIKKDELTFTSSAWSRISPSARELVAGLLEKTVWKRYTLAQALSHPWVANPSAVSSIPLDSTVIDSMTRFNARNRLRRDALRLVSSTLSANDVAKLRQQFLAMDTDTDLKVSAQELQTALANIGMDATAEQVKELMLKLDTDSDGLLDLNEFLVATTEMSVINFQNNVYWAFCQYDTNGDGKITVDELRAAFAKVDAETHGKNATPESEAAIREYIADADRDGDGQISYEEFLELLVPADLTFTTVAFS